MKKFILIALAFAGLSATAAPLSIKASANGPRCYGDHSGTISIMIVGGSGSYTYNWSDGLPASPTQTGLAAGTYDVTVVDNSLNSTATSSITIASPDQISLSTSATNVTSPGGSDGCIHLNVSGGTPDYTFQWDNSSTEQSPCGLQAGTYTVIVTDAFGCQASTSKTIYAPPHMSHVTHNSVAGLKASTSIPLSGSTPQHRSDMIGTDANDPATEITALTNEDVVAYPNPSSNAVAVRINTVNNAELSLINTLGQTVIHTYADSNETSLDVSNLAKGNYILMVKTEIGNVNKLISVIK